VFFSGNTMLKQHRKSRVNGSLEQVAWTQPNSATAFLAIDKNENGVIDNGLELVGNRVLEGAANAIQALSRMPGDVACVEDDPPGGSAAVDRRRATR
jgi:hypothetical protein